MALQAKPESQDHVIVRSEEIVNLFDKIVVNDTVERLSRSIQSGPFRHFTLYLRIVSTGTGAHIIQFVPRFLDPRDGQWYDLLQGLFASLFFEDTVTATERRYVFHGDCAGRVFDLKAVGTSTTGSLYFTVSAAVEFYN